MPRPVMRTLLPFLRCFTIKPTKSSRQPVASFLVMPVFSASSAATFESGTVGADGFAGPVGFAGAVAIVRGPLRFFVRQRIPDAPGQRWRAQGYPRIDVPQVPNARKISILGAFSAI